MKIKRDRFLTVGNKRKGENWNNLYGISLEMWYWFELTVFNIEIQTDVYMCKYC